MYNVVAVVVTFNRKDMLFECIHCLLNQKEVNCDLLIIDNASTDGTEKLLAQLVDKERINYYNTGENLGGAGGFSYGMRKAIELGYEYLWLMDDDVHADETALRELMRADEELHGEYGFLSSKTLWKDGSMCNMNRQFIKLRKHVDGSETFRTRVIMATFVSFFVRADMVKEVGLPIKEFFIWADDLEFSRRISRKRDCFFVPTSKVIHNMNSNNKVGIEQESRDRLWRYNYLYRNEFYLFKREGLRGLVYYGLRVSIHIIRVIFKSRDERMLKLRTILQSVFAGFSFAPSVEMIS